MNNSSFQIAFAAASLLAVVGNASAASDPRLCEMFGTLAQGVAEDRDRGISYDEELGKLKGAAKGLPSNMGIMAVAKSALKTAYLDMPKITPEGNYKLHYVACMSAK